MLGPAVEPLELIIKRRMLHKLMAIIENTAPPLHNGVETTECVQ